MSGQAPKRLAFAVLLVCCLRAAGPARAAGGTVYCNCYCNIQLPPPCGDEACKRACGYYSRSAAGSPKWLRPVVAIALVLSAGAANWTVFDAGHSGAKSVWGDVKVGEGGERGGDRGGDDD